ncbi:TPA: primase-helicase family protein [Escherichia coli]
MASNFDWDPAWREELGESAWFVYDAKHELDKVKTFASFLKVKGYYQRFDASSGRLFVTSLATISRPEELTPEIFLVTVMQRYNCFASLTEKERKAIERLVDHLPVVSAVIADPRLETGLIVPPNWTSWAINTWQHPVKTTATKFDDPAVVEAVCAVMELFARHFPIPAERDQIIGYIGHALQHPEERPHWHPLIRGVGGSGKSTLFVKILRAIFGSGHVNEQTDLAELDTPTTVAGWLGSLFVVCDDFQVQKRSQADNLKHTLTAPRMEARRLYQNATQEDVFSRFIFLSNAREPLKFVTEDRRFFVPHYCEHLISKEESAEFVAKNITPLLDSYGNFKDVRVRDALLDFFGSVSLAWINPGVPLETEDHQNMCGSGGTLKESQIQAFIDAYPVATYQSFKHYMFAEHGVYIGEVDSNIWEKLMRESGDWIRIDTTQNNPYKVQLSHPVGFVKKGKRFVGWCTKGFHSAFMSNLNSLYSHQPDYFATLWPPKS